MIYKFRVRYIFQKRSWQPTVRSNFEKSIALEKKSQMRKEEELGDKIGD